MSERKHIVPPDETSIGITEVRARIGELVDKVRYTGKPIIIEKGGKPAAAIVPLAIVERMIREREEAFDRILEVQANAIKSDMTEEELMDWVNDVIQEVRQNHAIVV